jgi:hypothetical protein
VVSELVLLGAGASVEADVPDANGMALEIYKRFRNDSMGGEDALESSAVIGLVISGLRFQKGIRNENVADERVNVEDLFNAVQLLANRSTLEAAPFIGSWHPMVVEFDTLYARDVPGGYDYSDRQKKPWEGLVFKRTGDRMIRKLAELVWIDNAERVQHLSPLLNLMNEQGGRLVIATLNYDNSIELMANTYGVSYSTGIEEWSESRKLDLSSPRLHLLKLHGSIDWYLTEENEPQDRPMPCVSIRQLRGEEVTEIYNGLARQDDATARPAVIFGQRNKLTAEGPFLDLLRAFQQELWKPETHTLTVVGYAFRDPHINTYISEWLNASSTNKIRIINPGLEESDEDYIKRLKTLRSSNPERVQVIKEQERCLGAGEGLLKIYGQYSTM